MESRRNPSNSTFLTPPTTPSGSGGGGGDPLSASNRPQSSGSGQGPRLIVDFSDLTVPVPTTPRTLQPEELRRLFLVSLEKMLTLEPESYPFRQPVDPEALGIPDYVDIIRRPMDLQTIRIKMNCLKYTDPWMYVDDVLLMFDNAWVYNRPTSKVYQYCSRLSEVFQQEINPVMTRLGYKHGRIHQFNSQTLSCFGRPVCLIPRNGKYFNFLRFHLCDNCYNSNLEEDSVKLPWQNNVSVNKENFIRLVNDSDLAYSPATEMHRAYQRDAEMSRALVIKEFLKLLQSPSGGKEKKGNVRKMLRLNSQLRSEFTRYFEQQKERHLLTPTETERVIYQLGLVELGEDCHEEKEKGQGQQAIGDDEVLQVTVSKSDDSESRDLDHCEEERERGTNCKESGDRVEDEARASADSPDTLGIGIELEESSSNCSTLSSLKSLN